MLAWQQWMSTTEQIMSADLTILRAPSWGQSGGNRNERAVSINAVEVFKEVKIRRYTPRYILLCKLLTQNGQLESNSLQAKMKACWKTISSAKISPVKMCFCFFKENLHVRNTVSLLLLFFLNAITIQSI